MSYCRVCKQNCSKHNFTLVKKAREGILAINSLLHSCLKRTKDAVHQTPKHVKNPLMTTPRIDRLGPLGSKVPGGILEFLNHGEISSMVHSISVPLLRRTAMSSNMPIKKCDLAPLIRHENSNPEMSKLAKQ